MRKLLTTAVTLAALAGCDVQPVTVSGGGVSAPTGPAPQVARSSGSGTNVADFRAVAARVEPVAESVCRQQTRGANCDFRIIVESDPGLPANAAQTYDRSGRPIIIFTANLLKEMRNRDEVAFALSHEAAHHIEGHIEQTQASAQTGALLGVLVGSIAGLDSQQVAQARDIGGTFGARRYSKNFELEADRLGAIIAERAGYNAVNGVQYFARAADPGDRFLGTHPPNRDRITIVRQTVGR